MSKNHTGNVQNQIIMEEHDGETNSKRFQFIPLSYYRNCSLISGYSFHGVALPGSNPTTSSFRLMREKLDDDTLLFANGSSSFINAWSSASLASITYA